MKDNSTKTIAKNNIADLLKTFFDAENWKYTFDEDSFILRVGVKFDKNTDSSRVEEFIYIEDGWFCVFAKYPDTINLPVCPVIPELICRLNDCIINGGLEISFDNGSIRYKIFVNCKDLLPTTEVLKDSIFIPIIMINKLAPVMQKVILGEISPHDAVTKLINDGETFGV